MSKLDHDLCPEEVHEIVNALRKARSRAYCPYSHAAVGCAIYTRAITSPQGHELCSDEITIGWNIENSSYGASMCAERVALYKCLGKVSRAAASPQNWTAMAVVGSADSPSDSCFAKPCGLCRQVLSEFLQRRPRFPIILFDPDFNRYTVTTVPELMPSP